MDTKSASRTFLKPWLKPESLAFTLGNRIILNGFLNGGALERISQPSTSFLSGPGRRSDPVAVGCGWFWDVDLGVPRPCGSSLAEKAASRLLPMPFGLGKG